MATRGPGFKLTDAEQVYLARLVGGDTVTALAIIRAESGGISNAFRPASLNRLGGDDRGIWQLNSKAFPDIPDAVAFDPLGSTIRVRTISANGTKWGPWNYGPDAYSGRPRTDLDRNAAAAILAREGSGTLTPRMTELSKQLGSGQAVGADDLARQAGGAVADALGPVLTPWATVIRYATKLLSVLTSLDFWRRAGLVVAGSVLLLGGIALIVSRRLPTSPAAVLAAE